MNELSRKAAIDALASVSVHPGYRILEAKFKRRMQELHHRELGGGLTETQREFRKALLEVFGDGGDPWLPRTDSWIESELNRLKGEDE